MSDIGATAELRLVEIAERCKVKGWDSYGADPVTPSSLNAVRRFLANAQPVPTNDGGMQIEWHMDGYDIEIVWDYAGNISGFFWERT